MIDIIPAIDIVDGRCVRLSQGDYDRLKCYADDPVEVALSYERIGLRRLHLVDLDGAKAAAPVNLDTLRRIAGATRLDIEFGGGIKSADSLREVFDAGASRAICGSVAVCSPDEVCGWLDSFGGGRIVLGVDLREGRVATHGWLRSSELTAEELIDRFLPHGLRQVVCTDISRDGMLAGPSFGLYGRLQAAYPDVEITVSGGIGSMEDIRRLDEMGLRSAIVGKAVYEGRITLEQIERCLRRE